MLLGFNQSLIHLREESFYLPYFHNSTLEIDLKICLICHGNSARLLS
jgi:hypothetical protein